MNNDINYEMIIRNAIDKYKLFYFENKGEITFRETQRIIQANTLISVFQDFPFKNVNLIETGVSGYADYGMFGLILGYIVNQTNGKMVAVDLDCNSCDNSEKIFKEEYPNLKYKTYCKDSLDFLKEPPFIPNVVHLDSYDFNLYNPFPSALHAWKEFKLIEEKMETGSLIIIDDNWIYNTYLEWFIGGEEKHKVIEYPIVGKGANIYNEVINKMTNWELVGDHYNTHDNIKVIIRKK